MKKASETLSAASHEQASAIQETVSTLDEITAMVKTSANNASDRETRADRSYQVTMDGKKSIQELGSVINLIIENNQKIKIQMDENSRNLDTITSTINEISTIIRVCENSFDEVVENVSEVKQMMGQVAGAVSEQSIGVDNISQAMNELDNTVQQNSRAASETYDHAEKLSGQSERLDKIVANLYETVHGSKKTTSISDKSKQNADVLYLKKTA